MLQQLSALSRLGIFSLARADWVLSYPGLLRSCKEKQNMAAALMPKLFVHLGSRLCFTPIVRLPTVSSNFISGVFQKRKATTLSSDHNTRESCRKHDRDRRSYFPISCLVLGTLYLSNSSTANCVGEDSVCGGSGSCPSEEEQKQTTTPITSGFPLRDISGRFSSSSKKIVLQKSNSAAKYQSKEEAGTRF